MYLRKRFRYERKAFVIICAKGEKRPGDFLYIMTVRFPGEKESGPVFAFFDQLRQLNLASILLRLTLAMLFGGLIGLER